MNNAELNDAAKPLISLALSASAPLIIHQPPRGGGLDCPEKPAGGRGTPQIRAAAKIPGLTQGFFTEKSKPSALDASGPFAPLGRGSGGNGVSPGLAHRTTLSPVRIR